MGKWVCKKKELSTCCNVNCEDGCLHINVCRQRTTWMYTFVPSVSELCLLYSDAEFALRKASVTYHESIDLGKKHKFFFDLDVDLGEERIRARGGAGANERVGLFSYASRRDLVERMESALEQCYHMLERYPDYVCYYDSSSKLKVSFHVVLQGIHSCSLKETKAFASAVQAKLKEMGRALDMGVYKSWQNVRMLGTSKREVMRFKHLCSRRAVGAGRTCGEEFSPQQWLDVPSDVYPGLPELQELQESLITCCKTTVATKVDVDAASVASECRWSDEQHGMVHRTENTNKSRAPSAEDQVHIWKKQGASAYAETHEDFGRVLTDATKTFFGADFCMRKGAKLDPTNNIVNFDRKSKGHCPICQKQHTSDNVCALLFKQHNLRSEQECIKLKVCDVVLRFSCMRAQSAGLKSIQFGVLHFRGSKCLLEKTHGGLATAGNPWEKWRGDGTCRCFGGRRTSSPSPSSSPSSFFPCPPRRRARLRLRLRLRRPRPPQMVSSCPGRSGEAAEKGEHPSSSPWE